AGKRTRSETENLAATRHSQLLDRAFEIFDRPEGGVCPRCGGVWPIAMDNPKKYNARVLMICDDVQIDRRIILEAQTLIRQGCEVIVIGRAGAPYPVPDMEGGVKIEYLDCIRSIPNR